MLREKLHNVQVWWWFQCSLQWRFRVVFCHPTRIHPMFQKQADNIGLVLVDRLLQKCVPSRKSTFELRGRNCFEESSEVFLCFHCLPFLADQLGELGLEKVQGQLGIF